MGPATATRCAAAARLAAAPVLPVRADLVGVACGAARIQLAREPRPTVRLTQRGKRVVMALTVVCVLVVIALAWLAGAASARAAVIGAAGSRARVSPVVVVQPGDTLWSIAQRSDPAADPRAAVQEIVSLNDLHGVALQPGQRLRVPHG
jgi:hypothetical protein